MFSTLKFGASSGGGPPKQGLSMEQLKALAEGSHSGESLEEPKTPTALDLAKEKWKMFKSKLGDSPPPQQLTPTSELQNQPLKPSELESSAGSDKTVVKKSFFQRVVSSMEGVGAPCTLNETSVVTGVNYEAQVEALLGNLHEAQSINRELHTELQALRCNAEGAETELPALRSQVARLLTENKRHTDLYEMTTEQVSQQQGTIRELERTICDLRRELTTAHHHVERKREESNSLSTLQQEIEASRQLTERYKVTLDDAAKASAEVTALREELRALKAACESSKALGNKVEEAMGTACVNRLSAEMILKCRNRTLLSEVTSLRHALQVQTTTTKAAQERSRILQRDLDNVDQRILDAQAQQNIQLRKTQDKVRELQDQVRSKSPIVEVPISPPAESPATKEMNAAYATLTDENMKLLQRVTELQQVKWQLEQQVESLMAVRSSHSWGRGSLASSGGVAGVQKLVEFTLERNMQLERDVKLLGDEISASNHRIQEAKEAFRTGDEKTLQRVLGV